MPVKNERKSTQAAQVYFPVDTYVKIKLCAEAENLPIATWIREIVVKEVHKKEKHMKKFSDLPTFTFKKHKNISSENLDDLLYAYPHGST